MTAQKTSISIIDLEIEKIERSACSSIDIDSASDESTKRIFKSGLDWIANFIMIHHPELGRRGAVCPFVGPSHCEGSLLFCSWDVKKLSFEIFLSVLKSLSSLYQRLSPGMFRTRRFSICIFLSGLKEDQYSKYIDEAHSVVKPVFMDAGLMIGEFHPLSVTEGVHSETFRPMRSSQPAFVVRYMTLHDAMFIDRDGSPAEVRLRELLNYRFWMEEALPKDDISRIEKRIEDLKVAIATRNGSG